MSHIKNNECKYFGVTPRYSQKYGKKINLIRGWIAQCYVLGEKKYIGYFETANLAAKAYNDFIIKNIENKAKLNTIIENEYNNKIYSGNRREKLNYYNSLSKDQIINNIYKNITEKNKIDNENIIKYLSGNDRSIWNVFIKYKKIYIERIKFFIKDHVKKNTNKKTKESAETIEDIVTDFNIYLLDKIKGGYFDGKNFKSWSEVCCRNYFVLNYMKRKDLKDVIDISFR